MLARINTSLSGRPIEAQFVCITYAIWDPKQKRLELANSGLPRPIFCRGGKAQRIEATGLPLGLFPTAEYEPLKFEAQPGDVFLFFSDGLIDAANAAGELFGRTRIEKIVAENCGKSADELVQILFDAAAEHAAGVDAFDDQTAVALKVL